MRGLDPRARTRNGWDGRSDATVEAKKIVLEALEGGSTVKQAVAAARRSIGSYQKWRQHDPQFKAECEIAKAAGRHEAMHPSAAFHFAEFRAHYFGMETFVHHQQIVDACENAKPREIVLVNIWPGAGKTTTLEDWICQQLALDPNRRITDVSASAGLARKSIGKIKARMTDTRQFGRYINTFGPFYEEGRNGKPWAADYFTVLKAQHDERDYSMEARAITSNAYGSRMDDLLVDDIQSRQNLSSTETILDNLRLTYFSRGAGMRIFIIGTRIGPGDVYERLLEEGAIDKYIVIPAVQPTGEITCPEMWGLHPEDYETREEFIEKVQARIDKTRAQNGEAAWWASYQQAPHTNQLATFTTDMIDGVKDFDRRVAKGEVGDYVALSLDPTLGGGNALTACNHKIDKLEIMDQRIDYGFSRTEDILAGVEDFCVRYFPIVLVVERDAFQKSLVNDSRLADISRRYGLSIVPHTTSRNKADPILGVASMAGDFIAENVSIPWGDEFSRKRMEPLTAQLRAWRPDVNARMLKQDGVMSLWFNWRYWKENLMARGQDLTIWNRGGTPYKPTGYSPISTAFA